MAEHWTADKETSGQPAYVYSGSVPEESRIVGKIYREVDAALIIKAVSNHDVLVKALEEIAVKGRTTGYGRSALRAIAVRALNASVGTPPAPEGGK